MSFSLRSSLVAVAGMLVLSAGALAQTAPATTTTTTTTTMTAPTPAPISYKLDNSAGAIYVQVYKDPTTLAASLSHDHIIVSKGWSGSVTWDPTNPGACKVDITVPVNQLDNDNVDWRKKVGYDTVLDDGDRAEVKEHMLEEDQLNAAKYPTISFKATKCEGSGTAIKVTGDFTLRGVTKSISVPMTISATDTAITAKGSFKVNQSSFGFQPYSALLGQLKNKDEMSFTIDVKGNKS